VLIWEDIIYYICFATSISSLAFFYILFFIFSLAHSILYLLSLNLDLKKNNQKKINFIFNCSLIALYYALLIR